ncbi:MAG: hypothetical protein ACOX6P_04635 [Candidatus Merdivicinus sp.]
MNKKIVAIICALMSVSMVGLTSCGQDAAGANADAADQEGKKEITISVRKNEWGGRGYAFEEAAVRLNQELEENGEDVVVTIDFWPAIDDDELVLQGQAGNIADVTLNSSVDIGWEYDAGLIQPIDWVADSEVFEGASESIMNIMYYDGHYMGVIQDMDASPVFISRKALEGLGWSEEEIDGLREKVDNGEFIMSDLMETAQQAMEQGLVDIGFAVEDTRFEGWTMSAGYNNYNLEENKLVVNEKAKDVYKFWEKGVEMGVIKESIGEVDTDTAAPMMINQEIFATFARSEFYRILADNMDLKITDAEFQDWFDENIVWTPVPASEEGGQPSSYSNPAMLFVGSSVDEEKMPYVQRYLELMLSPDIQVNHTINSGKLPVTPAAMEEVVETLPFYADHYYMTDFTKVRPAHPDYSVLIEAYTLGVDAILTKGQTAEEAYELYIKDAKQNVPSERIIFEE